MAEANKVAAEAAKDGTSVVTEQSTVTVLDSNGNDLGHNGSELSSIFDKIEQGAKAEDAIKETQSSEPKKEPAKEPAKEPDKVVEKPVEKEAPKPDEKPAERSDDIFNTKEERQNLADEKKAAEDKKELEAKAKDSEEPTEEELQVLPHDKPKTAKRITTLLSKITQANNLIAETKKEADAKAAKLAELETELTRAKSASPEVSEEIKKQLDDLKMYRRRYELDKDPEVKAKFDSRVESAEASIRQTLTKRGAGEQLLKIIEEEGGWLKFSDSSRDIELSDGRSMKAAELADAIKKTLPFSERRAVDTLEIEQVQTRRERERFFEDETKAAKTYFESKEVATKAQVEAQQKQVEAGKKLINDWRAKVAQEQEWLKEKPVPATATQEQKAEIEDDNKHTKQIQAEIDRALGASKLDDMLEVVLNHARYFEERRKASHLLDRTKLLEAQLAEKQAELDRFKKAGSSVPKGGSLVGGGRGAEAAKKPALPEGLEAAFDRLQSGQSLTESE